MANIVVSVTIKDAKVASAKQGFERIHPKPEGYSGTDKAWFEEVVKNWLNKTVQRGLRDLALVGIAPIDITQ